LQITVQLLPVSPPTPRERSQPLVGASSNTTVAINLHAMKTSSAV